MRQGAVPSVGQRGETLLPAPRVFFPLDPGRVDTESRAVREGPERRPVLHGTPPDTGGPESERAAGRANRLLSTCSP